MEMGNQDGEGSSWHKLRQTCKTSYYAGNKRHFTILSHNSIWTAPSNQGAFFLFLFFLFSSFYVFILGENRDWLLQQPIYFCKCILTFIRHFALTGSFSFWGGWGSDLGQCALLSPPFPFCCLRVNAHIYSVGGKANFKNKAFGGRRKNKIK